MQWPMSAWSPSPTCLSTCFLTVLKYDAVSMHGHCDTVDIVTITKYMRSDKLHMPMWNQCPCCVQMFFIPKFHGVFHVIPPFTCTNRRIVMTSNPNGRCIDWPNVVISSSNNTD